LGVFFTNTSGHPAGKVQGLSQNWSFKGWTKTYSISITH
jgi:hypothetical protein